MDNARARALKLYIFYCTNGFDIHEFDREFHETEGFEYRKIGLPCSGKANLLYFLKAFEKGADGLILVICEKNKCHYHEGNLRSPKRAREVSLLLDEIGMGEDRVAILSVEDSNVLRVVAEIGKFQERIRKISLNYA